MSHASMDKHAPLVVVISAFAEDRAVLDGILGHLGWRVVYFKTLQETLLAAVNRASVVLCDEHLSDGGWRDVMRRLETAAEPPFLIVSARHASDRLWAEVLNEGGHDVLAKPFRTPEVVQSVAAGLRRRESHKHERKYRTRTGGTR